jgi:hypothetical protein
MNRREFLKKSLEGIVIGGIPLIYNNCDKNPVKSDELYTKYSIEKCLKSASKVVESKININIKVQDNNILFDHFLDTYCNALEDNYLSLDSKVEGNLIEVNEVFNGEAVKCVCSFPIKGEITNLEKREYTIKFIYKGIVGGKLLGTSILYEGKVDLR